MESISCPEGFIFESYWKDGNAHDERKLIHVDNNVYEGDCDNY